MTQRKDEGQAFVALAHRRMERCDGSPLIKGMTERKGPQGRPERMKRRKTRRRGKRGSQGR